MPLQIRQRLAQRAAPLLVETPVLVANKMRNWRFRSLSVRPLLPSMIVISHLTGRNLALGLQNSDLVLLPLTLVLSIVTFSSGRTNVLQGAVHLLLFAAYLMLIFQR